MERRDVEVVRELDGKPELRDGLQRDVPRVKKTVHGFEVVDVEGQSEKEGCALGGCLRPTEAGRGGEHGAEEAGAATEGGSVAAAHHRLRVQRLRLLDWLRFRLRLRLLRDWIQTAAAAAGALQ